MGKSNKKYVKVDLAKVHPALPLTLEHVKTTKDGPTLVKLENQNKAAEILPASLSHSQNTLDPYARVYVPHALKHINKLIGTTIYTRPLRQVDYTAYISSHVGTDFLSIIPSPSIISLPDGIELVDEAFHVLYESYFRHHIAAEIEAQAEENENYSLYEHDALVVISPHEDVTCSFIVPGLRENSPYLEEGDVVELRQFVPPGIEYYQSHDSYTPVGIPLWTENRSFDYWKRNPHRPLWTGTIFKARVLQLQRRQERVTLCIEDPNHHLIALDPSATFHGEINCKFNIQFPVNEERYICMQHVLPVIQQALVGTARPLVDFGTVLQPPQAKITSSGTSSRRNWLLSMLCPSTEDCLLQSKLNPGTFTRNYFDSELNWEQKKAVESVCLQDYGTVPFLISGPPGTGKTKSLVELALQLAHKAGEVCHILFCAPSDPAADTLVQRLSNHCKPGELLRLNRTSRTFAEVPGTILPFCYIVDDIFALPPFAQLMKYKIVVTTTRDASMLMYARLTNAELYASQYGLLHALFPYDPPPSVLKLHWSALLIDEAAQATEPEVLIPLSIIAPPPAVANLLIAPLFVMAGDEYQLGPRLALINSPLKTSLFARLFARPVYDHHPLARGKMNRTPPALSGDMLPILRPAFANLIRNYRSHPAILAVPSNLFYADTLEHLATDINRLSTWRGWKGKKWPVLFYNNSGEAEDTLEMDGGGWFNVKEAHIACDFAKKIMQTGLVQQHEICIMSPFKAQVKCLRNMIKTEKYGSLYDVDVGPTEAFQGLERGIVILCTTRTKERFVSKDQELGWGIVGMPTQMNVALTRAKFGLIVIGKTEVLESDENWRAFMSFCARNDLWDGKPFDWTRGGARNRLEKVLLAEEEAAKEIRRRRVLKVWNRGHSSGMGDEAMWHDGMQAEEDDMGATDGEESEDDGTARYDYNDLESDEGAGASLSAELPQPSLDQLHSEQGLFTDEE